MSGKTSSCIGIEFDERGLRAARVSGARSGRDLKCAIEILHEVAGDFSNPETLANALGSVASKFRPRSSDCLVTCVSGRQVFLTQIRFKPLPEADMKKALRAEIRKNLSFEMTGASLDYQIMEEKDPAKTEIPLVTVTVVSKSLIEQQTSLLVKAGLPVGVVDVLPAAAANSWWIGRPADGEPQRAHVVVHLTPGLCTVVIDGPDFPFYSRSIYFPAEQFLGPGVKDQGNQNRFIQLDALGEEIRRSLAFYGTTHGVAEISSVNPIGNYADRAEVLSFFGEKTGLPVEKSTLLGRIGCTRSEVPGRYDVAVALAVRGIDQ